MGLTIANANIQVLANKFLAAYQVGLESIGSFAFRATNDQIDTRKGDTIKVPVYTIAGDAGDFDKASNNYEDEGDQGVTFVNVLIDKHKKRTIGVDDFERLVTDEGEFIREMGINLAKTVIVDIYGNITIANFPTAAFTGAATAFDSDDIADFSGAADTAAWGMTRRAVLNSAFTVNLMKDDNLKKVNESGSSETLRQGNFGEIHGFEIDKTLVIPDNGEFLAGYITDGTAIAVALALPRPPSDQSNQEFAIATEPMSGLSIMVRRHYSAETGEMFLNVETVYGSAVIRAEGLQRIATA